jgi:Alpha/beta hydrolase
MPIPEPADALWADVSKLTTWPDSDEDAVRTMSAGWRGGGDHFTKASAFDLAPVAEAWTDRAGQAFYGRTTQGLRTAALTGAEMTELAGRADAFAAEVTGVKNGIHDLMAANQAGFAQAAASPGDARATFVQQVAAMVDTMKNEAAARISAAGPATARPAQEMAPAGPPNPDDPRAVKAWWDGLHEEERDYFRTKGYQTIRNLDGVPAADRDQANRHALTDAIVGLQDQERHEPGSTNGRRDALVNLQKRLETDQNLLLIGFDNEGDGKAIVSVGNPDTAKHVSTLVPGITNELDNIDPQISRANDLRADGDTASIVWLDYNTPEAAPFGGGGDSLTLFSRDRAAEGAGDLARFQNGLRATHVGDPSFNTVIAHSYGTTVAGLAAYDHGLNTDRLVLVASTDPGVDFASEYRFENPDGSPVDDPAARVYATTADGDWRAQVTSALANPTLPWFGAHVFPTPPHPGDEHSGLFYPEGLPSLRRLILGQEP